MNEHSFIALLTTLTMKMSSSLRQFEINLYKATFIALPTSYNVKRSNNFNTVQCNLYFAFIALPTKANRSLQWDSN